MLPQKSEPLEQQVPTKGENSFPDLYTSHTSLTGTSSTFAAARVPSSESGLFQVSYVRLVLSSFNGTYRGRIIGYVIFLAIYLIEGLG